MSSAWENCAESCNLIFAPTLSGDNRRSRRSGWETDGTTCAHNPLVNKAFLPYDSSLRQNSLDRSPNFNSI